MWSHEATRLVPVEPCALGCLVDAVATALWDGPRTRLWSTAASEAEATPWWRTYGVASGPEADEPEVWVTFQAVPAHGGSLVTVLLDDLEADSAPDPTEGLNHVLDALTVRAVKAAEHP